MSEESKKPERPFFSPFVKGLWDIVVELNAEEGRKRKKGKGEKKTTK